MLPITKVINIKTIILGVALLTGCAAMDQMAGVGQVTTSISTFDGDTDVYLSGSHNSVEGKGYRNPTKFGAKWSKSLPDTVWLRLILDSDSSSTESYTSFEKIKVNINGDIRDFPVTGRTTHSSSEYNTVSKKIYTSSVASVKLSKQYLKDMIKAESCKVRVYTNDSYEDYVFDVEMKGSQEMAKAKLKLFLEEIEKQTVN